jgi:hypothetical protein
LSNTTIEQNQQQQYQLFNGNNNLTEDEFLDKLGIGFMGVKLQQVIDEFIEE